MIWYINDWKLKYDHQEAVWAQKSDIKVGMWLLTERHGLCR